MTDDGGISIMGCLIVWALCMIGYFFLTLRNLGASLGAGVYAIRLEETDDGRSLDANYFAAFTKMIASQCYTRDRIEVEELDSRYELLTSFAAIIRQDEEPMQSEVSSRWQQKLSLEEESARVELHVQEEREILAVWEELARETSEQGWKDRIVEYQLEAGRLLSLLMKSSQWHSRSVETIKSSIVNAMQPSAPPRVQVSILTEGSETSVELLSLDYKDDDVVEPTPLPPALRSDMCSQFREYSGSRTNSLQRHNSQKSVAAVSVLTVSSSSMDSLADNEGVAGGFNEHKRLQDLLDGERLRCEELESKLAALEETCSTSALSEVYDPEEEVRKVREGVIQRLERGARADAEMISNVDRQVQQLESEMTACSPRQPGQDEESSEQYLLQKRIRVLQTQRNVAHRNREAKLREVEELNALLRAVDTALQKRMVE